MILLQNQQASQGQTLLHNWRRWVNFHSHWLQWWHSTSLHSFLHSLDHSVALQSKQCDLLEAYEECQTLITSIKGERKELNFHRLYARASTLLKDTYGEKRFLGLQQPKGMLRGQMHQWQLRKSSTASTITTHLLTMCYHTCRTDFRNWKVLF